MKALDEIKMELIRINTNTRPGPNLFDFIKGKTTNFYFKDIKTKDINKISPRYYLRFNVVDKPGVLAKLSKILGDNNISIAAVQQKEINKDVVPVIFITHQANEENLMKSIKEINILDIVKEDTVIIRIEDI